ncbi:MAG: SpoIIE family protein phosphatase [Clostridia bacterium]|nr:SpoIIE family protein phosphatase [Clostridia bacterium]
MEITKVKETLIYAGSQIKEKAELTPVVKSISAFIGSFLLMNPFVSGLFSPFAISLTACSGLIDSFWSGAGVIIGSFFFFDGTDCVRYCAAVLLCLLLKGLYLRYITRSLHDTAMLLNAFTCLFLTGAAIVCAVGFDFETFLCVFYESVLCCTGTYIFRKAGRLIWGKKEFPRFTSLDIITVLAALAIMLMPFYKYKIFGFSPVTMLFSACILLFARLRSSSGGALCGICLGAVAGLSSEVGFISIGYALGGLLGGELTRKGKPYCIAGFLVPITVCAFADGTLVSCMAVFESFLASAAFLAVPDSFFDSLCEKTNAPVAERVQSEDSRHLARRLNEVSLAINEVSACVDTVKSSLNPLTQTQLNEVLRSAWCKVCNECDLKESCRPEIRNPTDGAVEKIAQALQSHAALDETRFPKGFYSACYSFTEMRTELYDRYLSFVASLGAQGKISQIQGLMCDQFRNMAEILDGLADDFDENKNMNTDIAESCTYEAQQAGLCVRKADCSLDKFDRTTITLSVDEPRPDFNITQFTRSLSTAIGTKLDTPELAEEGDGECTLVFRQKIDFRVSIGAISRPTDNEDICGDYYRSFRDSNGRYIIILSDGMGTGSRAAVDSAMASELFSRLVRSGLGFDSALRIANSALLVKSTDESLATIDVVCLDLYTGKTDFMKAGAAATFIRHKGSVALLEQASLPIGILNDISFSKATAPLNKGDIILMVSDGILGDCNTWIQHELKQWDTQKSPDDLARFILDGACERKTGKHLDDMTVIAVYVE